MLIRGCSSLTGSPGISLRSQRRKNAPARIVSETLTTQFQHSHIYKLLMEDASSGAASPGSELAMLTLQGKCSHFGSGSLLMMLACSFGNERSFYIKKNPVVEGSYEEHGSQANAGIAR